MEVKKNIENLLLLLKEQGIDRRQIEKDLDYRKYYIDQLLSKGGNRKFLNRLEKYNIAKRNDVDKKIPAITDINFIGGKTKTGCVLAHTGERQILFNGFHVPKNPSQVYRFIYFPHSY